MIRLPLPLRGRRGVTLLELIIVLALLLVLGRMILSFFNVARSGYASVHARGALKTTSQKMLNSIGNTLVQNKRFLHNVPADRAYLTEIMTHGMAGLPAPLTGTRLPTIEINGALSPNASAGVFIATSVGNCLLFASLGPPQDMTVEDGLGANVPVRIDVYRFNFYYLALNTDVRVAGAPARDVWEWRSIDYPDYAQFLSVTDAVKLEGVRTELLARGYFWAWDSSALDMTQAFHRLDNPAMPTESHQIARQSARNLLRGMEDASVGHGARFAVSPNSGGAVQARDPVPLFGVADGLFPSGFEVLAVGVSGTRKVYMRSVLLAEGAFKGQMSQDMDRLVTARDIW